MSNPLVIIPQLVNSQITHNQAITIPYEFEAYELTGTGPDLNIDLVNVPFINHIGSVALTLLNIISEYRIISIFVILLLAIAVLFWIWRLVTETPSTVALNLWGGVDVATDIYEAQLTAHEGDVERMSRLSGDRSIMRDYEDRRQSVAKFRSVSRTVKRGSKLFK